MKKAYLILENGAVFAGSSFGYEKESFGQLVFNTSMTGYMELLTDSANSGKIVVSSFPLIGNAGVIEEDMQSRDTYLNGYIVREWSDQPSNFRSEGAIDFFLSKKEIPALCGVDTRALVRLLRDNGSMNAKISISDTVTPEILSEIAQYAPPDAVERASRKNSLYINMDRDIRVAVLDLGIGEDVMDILMSRDIGLLRTNAYTDPNEIISEVNGVIISSGGGDPTDYPKIISSIQKLARSGMPLLGIGMGFELLALAMGGSLIPLKYGHRGASQPVARKADGRILIAKQNHSFAVDSLPTNAAVTYQNVNDGSIEGARFGEKISGVEFIPEQSDSPQNTAFIIDEFISQLK